MGRDDGWVGALKALWEGGLRQMSVPGGEARAKGSSLIVVVLVAEAIAMVLLNENRETRRYVKCDKKNNREAMAGTYTSIVKPRGVDGLAIRMKVGTTSRLW